MGAAAVTDNNPKRTFLCRLCFEGVLNENLGTLNNAAKACCEGINDTAELNCAPNYEGTNPFFGAACTAATPTRVSGPATPAPYAARKPAGRKAAWTRNKCFPRNERVLPLIFFATWCLQNI